MEFTNDEYKDAMHVLSLYSERVNLFTELFTDTMNKLKERKFKRPFLTSFNNLRYCIEKIRLFTQQSVENLIDISDNFEKDFLTWLRRHPDCVPDDFQYQKYNINLSPSTSSTSSVYSDSIINKDKCSSEDIKDSNLTSDFEMDLEESTQGISKNIESNIQERILLDDNSEESPVYLETEDLFQYLSLKEINKIKEEQQKYLKEMSEEKKSDSVQDAINEVDKTSAVCREEKNIERIDKVNENISVVEDLNDEIVGQRMQEYVEGDSNEVMNEINKESSRLESKISEKQDSNDENALAPMHLNQNIIEERTDEHSKEDIDKEINTNMSVSQELDETVLDENSVNCIQDVANESEGGISEASTICLKNKKEENKVDQDTPTSQHLDDLSENISEISDESCKINEITFVPQELEEKLVETNVQDAEKEQTTATFDRDEVKSDENVTATSTDGEKNIDKIAEILYQSNTATTENTDANQENCARNEMEESSSKNISDVEKPIENLENQDKDTTSDKIMILSPGQNTETVVDINNEAYNSSNSEKEPLKEIVQKDNLVTIERNGLESKEENNENKEQGELNENIDDKEFKLNEKILESDSLSTGTLSNLDDDEIANLEKKLLSSENEDNNSEKEPPKEIVREDNLITIERNDLQSKEENNENKEQGELNENIDDKSNEKMLENDSVPNLDDEIVKLEKKLLYSENEDKRDNTSSEIALLKDVVVKVPSLNISNDSVLFEDLVSDIDSDISLLSNESLLKLDSSANKNTEINNLMSEIDTSDDEFKEEYKEALKEIMNDSMSSSPISASEESDNDVATDFENEFLNQTSGKIIKLNVNDLTKKVKDKPSISNINELCNSNSLLSDDNFDDVDGKLCRMRPVISLERVELPTAKENISKDDDDDISKLLNISSLKRHYPKKNIDNLSVSSSSSKSDSSVKKRLRKKRKKINTSSSSSNESEQSNNDSIDMDPNDSSDSSVTSSVLQKNITDSDSSVSLESNSNSEISSDDSDRLKVKTKPITPRKQPVRQKKIIEAQMNVDNNETNDILNTSDIADTSETPAKDSDWRNDPLLRINLNDNKSKKTKNKSGDSDSSSDIEIIGDSSEDDVIICDDDVIIYDDDVIVCEDDDVSTLDKKKSKKLASIAEKRKRIEELLLELSSDSNESNSTLSDDDMDEEDEDDEKASGEPSEKKKKIRKVLSFEELTEATKKANEEEKERVRRLFQRHSDYETIESQTMEYVNSLVLEYNLATEKPRIVVPEKLYEKLKDHQKSGVKFMWDSCFESIDLICKSRGSGCVLAHCMGLGKTLQVITLIYTLFCYRETKVKRVLILAPVSTIKNWLDEFRMWLNGLEKKFSVYTLIQLVEPKDRANKIKMWLKNGGIMIINYTLFRKMIDPKSINEQEDQKDSEKKIEKKQRNCVALFRKALLDPGPHLLICDEGHTLKNSKTLISKSINKVKTARRIMLTGTPMQNNLKEYYCMINLVKPNLLGSEIEFNNQFVNPITAGQAKDSSVSDIKRMKRRAHVLHKKLSGVVQRVEASVLKPYLPHLIHYIVFIKLSEKQTQIYKLFASNGCLVSKRLLPHYQIAKRISAHPICLSYQKPDEEQHTSAAPPPLADVSVENQNNFFKDRNWWTSVCSEQDCQQVTNGTKLIVFFHILNQSELIGDKVIVFSTSLLILNAVEHFLKQGPIENILNSQWIGGKDYFRVDGETPKNQRHEIYKSFNDNNNVRLRLLITSTKVSGLGVNLVGANRIVILDTPWNPADDMQSVYRIYRFGQYKKCYVYSLVSLGTMEEKIYKRSVTKQALSCRVVDEQQIDRHYARTENIANEFYKFEDYDGVERPPPNVPSDRILANLLQKYPDIVWKYHEHDKLLENQEDEELDEAEREAAWQEFQMEETRRHTNNRPQIFAQNLQTNNQQRPPVGNQQPQLQFSNQFPSNFNNPFENSQLNNTATNTFNNISREATTSNLPRGSRTNSLFSGQRPDTLRRGRGRGRPNSSSTTRGGRAFSLLRPGRATRIVRGERTNSLFRGGRTNNLPRGRGLYPSSRRRMQRRGIPRGTRGGFSANNPIDFVPCDQTHILPHLYENQHTNEMILPDTNEQYSNMQQSSNLDQLYNNQRSTDLVSIYDNSILYDDAEIITSDIIEIDDPTIGNEIRSLEE